MLPLHNISFRRRDRDMDRTVQVANISASGIGFIRSSAAFWPDVGEIVEGTLTIAGREFALEAKVVRISSTVVGCVIDNNKYNMGELVTHYFDRELSAISMKDIKPPRVDGLPEGNVRCLVGRNSTQLFFIEKNGAIPYFSLTFMGQKIEGGSAVKPAGKTMPLTVQAAIRFIENVEAIDLEKRKALMEELKKL
jgi:hypothetical protein